MEKNTLSIIRRLLKNKAAKSKKSIISGTVGTVIAIAIFAVFLSDWGAAFGVILSSIVLTAIAVGVYFWLRAINELPDVLS